MKRFWDFGKEEETIVRGHYHDFKEAYDYEMFLQSVSGSYYAIDPRIVSIQSSGTVMQSEKMIALYNGRPIISWTDFFSGKCITTIFNLCLYCGNKDTRYEYNLLSHPVCIHCGAEIS